MPGINSILQIGDDLQFHPCVPSELRFTCAAGESLQLIGSSPLAGKVSSTVSDNSQFFVFRSLIDDHPELIDEKHIPVLKLSLWVILMGSAVAAVLLTVLAKEQQWRMYAPLAMAALAVAARVVLRFRGTVAALRLLAIGSWLLATIASIVAEGLRTPILLVYPTIVIFSGWVLGARYGVGLWVVSAIAVVGMAVGQSMGVIGGLPPFPPVIMAIVHLIVLTVSIVMTLYLLQSFHERYAQERRLNGEIKQTLEVVEKRESDLRAMAEHIPGLVFSVDRGGCLVFANRHFAEFFGVPANGLNGLERTQIGELIGHSDRQEFDSYYQAVLRGEVVEFLVRKRSAQGIWHSFDVTLVPKRGNLDEGVGGWYGLMHDVTSREQTVSELRDMTMRDPLTRLPNRLFLNDRLAHALERAARTQTLLAVLFIDLDHFKKINDTLGHAVGDKLLREIAMRLESMVRSADTVARIGGDEFVAVIEGVESPDSAMAVAAKILAELSRPATMGADLVQPEASIGVAVYPDAGRTGDELLYAADVAMYEAKAAGRNCCRMHYGNTGSLRS